MFWEKKCRYNILTYIIYFDSRHKKIDDTIVTISILRNQVHGSIPVVFNFFNFEISLQRS